MLLPGLPPTVELLLTCARTDAATGPQAERLRQLLARNVDGLALFEMAQWHRVTPLVWAALSALAPDGLAPGPRASFQAAVKANTLRNLYLTRRLVSIIRLFAANEIPALAYKGPVLAAQAYGQTSLRQFSDLDLLVRPEHVAAARALLLAEGFRQTWPAAALTPSQETRHLQAKYNFAYTHAADQVDLELHWGLTPNYLRIPPTPGLLWEGLQTLDLAGERLSVFRPERLLLILCVHGSNHCWLRLNWVCDVAELLRRQPALDWPAVISEARQWGCRRLLHVGLLLADGLFGLDLPDEVRADAGRDAGARRLAVQAAARLTRFPAYWLRPFEEPLFHLRMRERWSDRARYALCMATPTVRDWTYLPLPGWLAPLYYVVRPARLVIEHGFNLRHEGQA